jgi:GxxExxY protein
MELLYPEESYAIRGAIFDVYKQLGSGFLEEVYQECTGREFGLRQIPFEAQKVLRLSNKGVQIDKYYQPDFICYRKIIVELKAVKALAPEHEAQVQNYLKASGMRIGFG